MTHQSQPQNTTPNAAPVHARVQQQFGAHAQGYVTSATHAKAYSLDRLIELVQPEPGWRTLDIATGGGHTALALARSGAWTVAGDLTHAMLRAARHHIREQVAGDDRAGHVTYVQLDAERLPYPTAAFDAVTCRIAPHHFPDVARFVRECARVCQPGGTVAVIDQLSPPDPKAAIYVNNYERLRDPSHGWAYNAADWQGFFRSAGLTVTHFEDFDTTHDFRGWAARMSVDVRTLDRLQAMLVQAPTPVAEWMQPQIDTSGNGTFVIRQFLLLGQKPPQG